jgi:hypothetical protein
MMAARKRKSSKPRAVNPRSLANLVPGAGHSRPGDRRALAHGGYARVALDALDEKTAAVFAALSSDAPLRDHDGGLPSHDSVQVRLLADCLCRLDAVGAWLAGRWATPEARPALDLEMRLRREASLYLIEMGMTPRSRAALGIDVVRAERSLSDALAEGGKAVEARLQRDRAAAEKSERAADVIEGEVSDDHAA